MEVTTFLTTLVVSDDPAATTPASLCAVFAHVPDPRNRRGRRYPLALILTLLVLGKLAGETTPSGIAHWARLRVDDLATALGLPQRRLPCANTYTNVCAKLDVADLNRRLAQVCAPPLPPLPAPAAPAAAGAPLPPPAPGATSPWMARPCVARGGVGPARSQPCICSACML